jgi:hypothetical protein
MSKVPSGNKPKAPKISRIMSPPMINPGHTTNRPAIKDDFCHTRGATDSVFLTFSPFSTGVLCGESPDNSGINLFFFVLVAYSCPGVDVN